jgi:Tfp pilus assembly protein PilX
MQNSMRRQTGIALLTTILLMLLMSSLLVGFILMISSGQKINGMNNDQSRAFYAAEAGMEKMTADIGSLFDTNYSPTGTQISALTTTPPALTGISYVNYTGAAGSGYQITYPTDTNGNPKATITTIISGNYAGMTALATPYTLNVTARTANGSEVKLQRTTQTVGIPMFQFGVFSDMDLSFFAGPVFNFGGRTHTNGNLFLAANNGPLTLSQPVTAVKDVIRQTLENGYQNSSTSYGGTVNVFNGSGTRALALTEGSLTGGVGSSANPNWSTISLGSAYYAGNLRAAATGPKKPLQLGIVTLGSGSTQSIDILRRPVAGESSGVTAERYFAQASFRVLLSDNPTDITSLTPCLDTTVAPFNLADLAGDPTNAANWTSANAVALKTKMNTNNTAGYSTIPVPLAASGAALNAAGYNSADGYWLPGKTTASPNAGTPIIKGYIKIEIQMGTSYSSTPCGNWKDVTLEVLAYGYAGRNTNPLTLTGGQYGASQPLMNLLTFSPTGTQIAPSTCTDVHPNAIIRLERVRDNPSNYGTTGSCGVTVVANKVTVAPTDPADYWPNSLFDTREGTLRDTVPSTTVGIGTTPLIPYSTMVPLAGVMQYVELDATNLTKYLTNTLPGSGNQSYDANVAPNDYAIYISDRRGNYIASAPTTSWPPISPSGHETGEFGFEDFVNPGNPATGCPNSTLDSGEDLDGLGTAVFFTYGQDATRASQTLVNGGNGYYGAGSVANVKTALVGTASTNALTPNPSCTVTTPTPIWPFNFVVHINEARENPNFFFRKAVKIVNGRDIANLMNTCPTTVLCGLTIAAENPVYIQGDFNCFGGGCTATTWNNPHIAVSVAGDAVTLLSNNWNDVNSFISPYGAPSGGAISISNGGRNAVTTSYRTAIISGKGVYFPQPTGTAADYGTDGGLHNFLRYIENWGGQSLNYRGSLVSVFYNRQAIGTYKCCTTVYSPPSRGYNFDVEFLQPQLLPPRTPLFRDVNTTGFTQLLLPTQ